jgi:hypothetical protein
MLSGRLYCSESDAEIAPNLLPGGIKDRVSAVPGRA